MVYFVCIPPFPFPVLLPLSLLSPLLPISLSLSLLSIYLLLSMSSHLTPYPPPSFPSSVPLSLSFPSPFPSPFLPCRSLSPMLRSFLPSLLLFISTLFSLISISLSSPSRLPPPFSLPIFLSLTTYFPHISFLISLPSFYHSPPMSLFLSPSL